MEVLYRALLLLIQAQNCGQSTTGLDFKLTQANSVLEEKRAHVFLTNQTPVTYKLLTNLANQQEPPKEVNHLNLQEIFDFMMEQFHPKRFIVRERFKFWSNVGRSWRNNTGVSGT